jgi:SAM-dependent methyltransferase
MSFTTTPRSYVKKAEIKLCLGCGEYLLNPPYVNVDRRIPAAFDKDIHRLKVHDITKPLPWENGSVGHIVLHHALEHMTYEQGQELLEQCYRVLRKGGTMSLITPDFDWLVTKYRDQVETLPYTANLMLFCEGPEGDKHRSAWTKVLLTRAAWKAGFFVDPDVPIDDFPNVVASVDWQCGIWCIKKK